MALATLLQVIQAETVLCTEIGKVMDSILAGLIARDNARVQDGLTRFGEFSGSLAQAEAVRTRVYEELCHVCRMDTSLGMGALVARIDPERRPAFAAALREFRVAVYHMRSVSQGIAAYTNSQLITLESFMVELFPDRSTGTYGSDGSRRSSASSFLFNSLT